MIKNNTPKVKNQSENCYMAHIIFILEVQDKIIIFLILSLAEIIFEDFKYLKVIEYLMKRDYRIKSFLSQNKTFQLNIFLIDV